MDETAQIYDLKPIAKLTALYPTGHYRLALSRSNPQFDPVDKAVNTLFSYRPITGHVELSGHISGLVRRITAHI